ncbi:hypothetical protein KJ866_03995 [Patescibacteria group bacterium]|nr:hypothetical protein [Patescibacteria group bacterium]
MKKPRTKIVVTKNVKVPQWLKSKTEVKLSYKQPKQATRKAGLQRLRELISGTADI